MTVYLSNTLDLKKDGLTMSNNRCSTLTALEIRNCFKLQAERFLGINWQISMVLIN